MTDERQPPTIAAVERAADVLALFSESAEPTLGVTQIAQQLELSKAVVHRILSSLRAKGFVELDETTRRYAIGQGALRLGLAYLDRTDVPALARPVLQNLSRETGETATLSVRTGLTRVYVDQVTPDRDVKMVVQLGLQAPLHAGASSKAFLAFLDPEEQERYLQGPLEKVTPRTIISPRALRRELTTIRERGYASSAGERMEGAASVAAPVLEHDGRPAAVISVCGPEERFLEEADTAATLLLRATQELSGRLGRQPRAAGSVR